MWIKKQNIYPYPQAYRQLAHKI